MIDISIVRYNFSFEVTEDISLPDFAGSALRGAFGRALKKTACMTKENECSSCLLYKTCPYAYIFMPPPPKEHKLQRFSQIPPPYIIEPPDWGKRLYEKGEILSFDLVLIGKAIKELPLIIYGFERAFNFGIGKSKGTAKLLNVYRLEEDKKFYIYKNGELEEQAEHLISYQDNYIKSITLEITTPMRLQKDGHPKDSEDITARDFLIALVRRISLVLEFHCNIKDNIAFNMLSNEADLISISKDLKWQDWTRYSSRQHQKMILGGVVGRITLQGEQLKHFYSFLKAGEMLHVGKNTVFGMGKYKIIGVK